MTMPEQTKQAPSTPGYGDQGPAGAGRDQTEEPDQVDREPKPAPDPAQE